MGNEATKPARAWDVLLLGGPSGVGKTSVSYPLARHFGVGIMEVDDFVRLLERMTTPEQQPAVHRIRAHPDADRLSDREVVDHLLDLGGAMAAGLEAVIANHLETATPVVMEGDFILPALAARADFDGQPNGGRVRAVFLEEPDEPQLVANFLSREPHAPMQTRRARVSWLYGRRLAEDANRLGLPVLTARPWDTVLERVIAAVS